MVMIKKDGFLGYAAGIAAGASYGFNALFAKQLMNNGVSIYSMLFFRYILAAVLMALWMVAKRESFRIDFRQGLLLVVLGMLYASSSLGLFGSYNYIPAGLGTTIVYLYPVFTALLMMLLHQRPTWQTWLAIAMTLAGVVLMCCPSQGVSLKLAGVLLAASAALCYALYLVIVNNNKRIAPVSPHTITFYALVTGGIMFCLIAISKGNNLLMGLDTPWAWADILGLAVIPTMIAMLTLAISTRLIGATKTAVLGVFEPITAILIGILAFNETLTWNAFTGIAICIAAIIFLVTTSR